MNKTSPEMELDFQVTSGQRGYLKKGKWEKKGKRKNKKE